MATRAEQMAKTHQAILDTARELFLKKGYDATSTRDIANAIGITQPALYHHFKDKEVIFLAVITTVGAEIKAGIEAIQAHTTQVDWEPQNTPALWKEITPSETGGGEEIVPDYVKPTGGHDAHSKGYKARFLEKDGYDGNIRESLIDNNVWDYKEYPQGWIKV